MQQQEPSTQRGRGIYLLPNLFTTAALFAGFYAIVAAMQGHFEQAAVAVFVAMVLYGLDGRVARWTNTQSEFGAEYDSLSDMVSFGLAPSLVMYQWSLSGLGKVGWLAAFVYAAGAALRLARFNTQVGIADKRFFQGLASPAAAAVVAGAVWVGDSYKVTGADYEWLMFFLTVAAGVLMVSNIRYYSFKDFDLKGKVPFIAVLGIVLVFVLIAYDTPLVLFGIFFLYALSGPMMTIFMRIRRHRRLSSKSDEPEGDSNHSA